VQDPRGFAQWILHEAAAQLTSHIVWNICVGFGSIW
jgi:hypothetical protein